MILMFVSYICHWKMNREGLTPKAPTRWCPCKQNRKVAAHNSNLTMVSERFIMIYVSIYNLWMFMENINPIYKLRFNPMSTHTNHRRFILKSHIPSGIQYSYWKSPLFMGKLTLTCSIAMLNYQREQTTFHGFLLQYSKHQYRSNTNPYKPHVNSYKPYISHIKIPYRQYTPM